MIIVASLLLAQPSAAEDEAWQVLKARIESAPQDIATFIERRTGCNHFDGEAGSGYAEREKQVQAARTELRCDDIETDTRALEDKYGKQPALLQLLEETEDLLPW